MVRVHQKEVSRYMGVGSTVVGLVCYALSSSFNRLYGDWNSFKIGAYIVSGSIICLAILFPKAWQLPRIFHPSTAPVRFLVLISTTVYSFYLDRTSKTKPDACALISSAAFATTSLCMSKQIECGFQDLMYFFCGLLVMQLMQIKPLLVFVGIGVSCFLVILLSYLDPANRSQTQPPPPNRSQSQLPETIIEIPSLDARPHGEEEDSIQNQAAIATPVYTSAGLPSASLRYRSSASRASSLQSMPSAQTFFPKLKHLRFPSLKELPARPSFLISTLLSSPRIVSFSLDPTLLVISHFKFMMITDMMRRTRVLFGGDWIRKDRARVRELIERYQTSSCNTLLESLELNTSSESLVAVKDILRLFNMHFKDMCTVHSKWIVSGRRLRDDLRTSLANKLLPAYENFIHRFKNAFGEQASRYIEYEVPDIQAELGHLFGGTRGIDQPLREKGMKLKLE